MESKITGKTNEAAFTRVMKGLFAIPKSELTKETPKSKLNKKPTKAHA